MPDSMAQILVRNLEDDVVDALKRRAKARGVSLEQEVRDVLAEATRPTPDELFALCDRIRAMTPAGVDQSDSAALIREDRER